MPQFSKRGGREDASQKDVVKAPGQAQLNQKFGSTPSSLVPGETHDVRDKEKAVSHGFQRHEEFNIYSDGNKIQRGKDKRKTIIEVMAVLLIVLFPLVLIAPYGLLDSVQGVTLGGITSSVQRNAHDLIALFADPGSSGSEEIIVSRYLCIVLAGAALGVTGAVYQGALKNALASPSTLGVESGATVGVLLYLFVFGRFGEGEVITTMSQVSSAFYQMSLLDQIWYLYGRAICALVCAAIVVVLVVGLAKICGHGKTSGLWIIVTGTIVSTLLGSIQSTMSNYFEQMGETDKIDMIESVSVEAFVNIRTYMDVALVAIPVVICLILVFAKRSKIGLLSFGDDEARSMGINPNRTRNGMIAITTVMTGIVVAFCGAVGFLGFLVPHITRRFIGSDFRYLLPASALVGSLVLLVSYYLMSLFSSGASNYVGLLTTIIGFVVFIVMFIKQKGENFVRQS